MKRLFIGSVTILLLSIFTFPEVKIGIINSQKLIMGTTKGRAIAAELEKIGKEKQNKLDTMRAEIKKLEKDLMSPALNNQAKEKKALELDQKRTAIKRFVEDTQREIQLKTDKEMNDLKAEIQPIIQQVGKEKGLSIILEVTAVAYFDPAIDITDDIIRIMDSKTSGNK